MTDTGTPLLKRPAIRRLYGWLTAVAVILLVALALVTAFFFLGRYVPEWLGWWPDISVAEVEQYILDCGNWGMVISVGLMVAHSFVPLPAETVALANGMIYGAVTGSLLTWTGAMLGAQAAYWPARTLGHASVARRVDPDRMARITRRIDANCVVAMLGLRLVPVISFNLINYVAGLANVSWWTFTWTTGLGIVPFTVLFVLMGRNLESLSAGMWVAIGGAAILFISFVWWLQKRWIG